MQMTEKKPVYNGYTEYYMTGVEVREYFTGCYERFGRHHSQIRSYAINFAKAFPRVKDDVSYRLFINDIFCRIMNADTDSQVYFFGYTREKPPWAKD